MIEHLQLCLPGGQLRATGLPGIESPPHPVTVGGFLKEGGPCPKVSTGMCPTEVPETKGQVR